MLSRKKMEKCIMRLEENVNKMRKLVERLRNETAGETEKIPPFVAIGPEELEEPLGETITCWICGKEHEVKYGDKVLEDGTREPSKFLAYFNCGERTILCGIDGKVVRPKRRAKDEKSD